MYVTKRTPTPPEKVEKSTLCITIHITSHGITLTTYTLYCLPLNTTMALSTVLWGEGYTFLETWLSGHLGWGEPSESGESLVDLVKRDIHY